MDNLRVEGCPRGVSLCLHCGRNSMSSTICSNCNQSFGSRQTHEQTSGHERRGTTIDNKKIELLQNLELGDFIQRVRGMIAEVQGFGASTRHNELRTLFLGTVLEELLYRHKRSFHDITEPSFQNDVLTLFKNIQDIYETNKYTIDRTSRIHSAVKSFTTFQNEWYKTWRGYDRPEENRSGTSGGQTGENNRGNQSGQDTSSHRRRESREKTSGITEEKIKSLENLPI